jgi:low temperature requirement protein LtrA
MFLQATSPFPKLNLTVLLIPMSHQPNNKITSGTKPETRVTTLELFFDLVFVFTITQVTHLIVEAHQLFDLYQAFLVLAITWWMYDGYAWLTNNLNLSRTTPRLFLLAVWLVF